MVQHNAQNIVGCNILTKAEDDSVPISQQFFVIKTAHTLLTRCVMATLSVTFFDSLSYTKTQKENLRTVGLELEKHHNIANVPKLMQTWVDNFDLYEVIERPNHVVLKLKSNGLPALHVTIARDLPSPKQTPG